ncbi:MAG: phosphoribosylaminoimidazolesuccinocarboxamide synthase [Acidobacteriota bacterium]
MPAVVTTTRLDGVPLLRRGKVRDVYELGDHLLIVATDRLSAFDCVLPDGIPYKGQVLTQISRFWFERLGDRVPHHLVTAQVSEFPSPLHRYADLLAGRSMLVRKAKRLDIECVVRGYLIGSAWEDYQQTGSVGGIGLPSGLPLAGRLPEPIFTPASKQDRGHDENIPFGRVEEMVGEETADLLRRTSLGLYREAITHAEGKGIIIADTKFEFGHVNGQLMLIDEVLTPDSSRFWPTDLYAPGSSPPSFDKQFVRDYLAGLDWDRTPPAPSLPPAVVSATSEKYLEAYRCLTGRSMSEAAQ